MPAPPGQRLDHEARLPAVPFHRPYLTGTEDAHIATALASRHLRGDGPATERCAEILRSLTGAASVLLTPSCTDALELSGLLLDLGPGDEVVMPAFTFVSTANAFALRGARPVFVDVDPITLNVDPEAVAAAVTDRTRAVVAVHYGGIACDMDRLGALCGDGGPALVEDAAHGLGATHRRRPLGSLGALGALSFHATKNVQCGEGGALLVNDPALVERAEVLREKGTNRRAFLRGQVDRYCWVDIGSSYLLADVLAAMLLAQLEAFDDIQARRHLRWSTYADELSGWAVDTGTQLPAPHPDGVHAAHLFHLLLPTEGARDRFIAHLRDRGVGSAFHYVPLHLTEPARRLGHTARLPVTEDVAARLARLPLYPDLTAEEQDRVLEAVLSFRP